MENIPFIHLESLNITTLAGLGPKNRIVKFVKKSDLKDISSVKGPYSTSNQIQQPPTLLKQFQELGGF